MRGTSRRPCPRPRQGPERQRDCGQEILDRTKCCGLPRRLGRSVARRPSPKSRGAQPRSGARLPLTPAKFNASTRQRRAARQATIDAEQCSRLPARETAMETWDARGIGQRREKRRTDDEAQQNSALLLPEPPSRLSCWSPAQPAHSAHPAPKIGVGGPE